MPIDPHDTCWTMLRAASAGDAGAKSIFARSYTTPIRAYLGHRWRGNGLASAIDDALQDVFVECMKPGGVLDHADQERGDFRALLYGVVRNVARRFEKRAASPSQLQPAESVHLDELPAQQEALSRVFDRAWARSLLREAVLRHAQAARRGDEASVGGRRSARPSRPARSPCRATRSCTSDPLHPIQVLSFGNLDAQGRATFTAPVPNLPSVVGLALNCQPLFFGQPSPGNLEIASLRAHQGLRRARN